MKNVLILTEGGRNIGYGHLVRCLSLCQAFEAEDINTQFIVNGDDSINDILRDRTFRVLNWIEEHRQLEQTVNQADAVLVDSYLAGIEVYRWISSNARIPVYLDDTRRLDYPSGTIVNWGIGAHKLGYPENENISYLLGPSYISLRKPFWEIPEKEIKKDVQCVMVTFGGDDSKNITPKVLDFLTHRYPALEKQIVIGSAFQNTREIEAAADAHTQLIHSPDARGMKTLMMEDDIAVSSGGQTLYELARAGVPTIAVAVAENQRNNVEGWAETRFIENAGFWKDAPLIKNIAAAFQRLHDMDRRVRSYETGRRLVPGNGAGRIINHIFNTGL
ncbi:MAG: UDP-2,4-diacetamido-2,4,6-trideoxy-beta-L-altropyranose hydrolase [bacterium]|nr:UDP-2,4-diacetamido-2,4,6-trideoxy-beta-L-altropyranose hydrolase [bacterium]